MVDCAEGTTRQFALQPERDVRKRLKLSRINKIFITHLHCERYSTSSNADFTDDISPVDHCMGLITLLASILRGSAGAAQPPRTKKVRNEKIVSCDSSVPPLSSPSWNCMVLQDCVLLFVTT